ncbi:hypothetical protein BDZ89DRAFT_923775, partial [Hymenopellis radicata]
DNNARAIWGSPDSLISREAPFLHVANFSDQPVVIAAGQVIAQSYNPRNWLDKRADDAETRQKQEQYASLVKQMVEKGRDTEIGPISDPRSSLTRSETEITSKAQRNATEADDPSASEPIEGGPKTSDTPPDPTSSQEFLSAVNI